MTKRSEQPNRDYCAQCGAPYNNPGSACRRCGAGENRMDAATARASDLAGRLSRWVRGKTRR